MSKRVRAHWRLIVSGPAERDIARLPEKAATAVIEALGAIEDNPERVGKELRFELEGFWSARRGSYRIIYTLDRADQVVTVVAIDHRADIYRRL